MVLFLFLVSVRSAKISANKIKNVKKLFIYLVKYDTKTSAKISIYLGAIIYNSLFCLIFCFIKYPYKPAKYSA